MWREEGRVEYEIALTLKDKARNDGERHYMAKRKYHLAVLLFHSSSTVFPGA